MEQEFIKGQHYMVKHRHGKKLVRRIFKYTEKRFDAIVCYVFTGKITKDVSVTIETTTEEGPTFFKWRGCKHVPKEVSIPYYDLIVATKTED
jgi:hypothetical protein